MRAVNHVCKLKAIKVTIWAILVLDQVCRVRNNSGLLTRSLTLLRSLASFQALAMAKDSLTGRVSGPFMEMLTSELTVWFNNRFQGRGFNALQSRKAALWPGCRHGNGEEILAKVQRLRSKSRPRFESFAGRRRPPCDSL